MSAIDILILATLAISTCIGGFRGVFKEALSLAAWVAGLWFAFHYYSAMGQWLHAKQIHDSLKNPLIQDILGFLVILVGVFLVTATITWLIKGFISLTGLAPIDRVLGLAFGLARGILIIVAFVYLGEKTSLPETEMWKKSKFIQPFKIVTLVISGYLPKDF